MRIFDGAENMLVIVCLSCLVVVFAMMIDLASGLYKAKQRKEIRSSYGLRRSLGKFIMYEGGMLIAAGVDLLMHFCQLLKLLRLDVIYGVPIITCLVGMFLLAVEFISVREKADKKTQKDFSKVAQIASKLINKEELVDALTNAIVESRKQSIDEDTN